VASLVLKFILKSGPRLEVCQLFLPVAAS